MKNTITLKNHLQFQNVYDSGKSYANKYLVMYVLENQLEYNRIGYTVTKKVGNSVVRHHLKRLLRESYRLSEEKFSSGLDIVIVARNTASSAGFHEIDSAVMHLSKLHHILIGEWVSSYYNMYFIYNWLLLRFAIYDKEIIYIFNKII